MVTDGDKNRESDVTEKFQLFSEAEFERVKQAVQDAESVTSAEILPVVARSSGRYDRPEDIVGLWVAILVMVAVWVVYPVPSVETGNWGVRSPVWQLVALIIGAVGGFVAGAILGTRVNWLKRLFTPQVQMRDEVYARAKSVFFDNRVHHTNSGSGVLLYISLFEHMAAVIADQNVLDKLGQQRIDQFCHEFTQRLHEGSPIDALCTTAIAVGEHLAPVLPRQDVNVNELDDVLVVID